MHTSKNPIFFFEVNKDWELQDAFDKLIANPIRQRCFGVVVVLFICYLGSFFCLYIPEHIAGARFYDLLQQWCPLFCRGFTLLMAAAIVPGELACRLVELTSSQEQMLRKSLWFLGENSKTMILMKPSRLVYDEFFRTEEWIDLKDSEWEALVEKKETRFFDYIQELQKMTQLVPEVADAYENLAKQVAVRAGKPAFLYWQMACIEVCVKQYEMKNQEFLREEGFEHYRNVCGEEETKCRKEAGNI